MPIAPVEVEFTKDGRYALASVPGWVAERL